jgi:dihydropteroate synthase
MLCLEDLLKIAESHSEDLAAQVASFDIGDRHFDFNSSPHLMGVVNLSPDSWYSESVCLSAEKAVDRGLALRTQGAVLVDLGAESSLLDAARADSALQESRLIPVVSKLSSHGVTVSVETYLTSVARASIEAGAKVVNVTGPGESSEIYRIAAEHDAAVIICYVQGKNVRSVDHLDLSADQIPILEEYFEREIQQATNMGLDKILVDPGLGFYYRNLQDSQKRIRHQIKVFLNTFRLRKLGWPVCHALPHASEIFQEEVRCAEPFFAVLAALGKTSLIRTHEVPRTKAVLDTLSVY